MGLSDFSSSDLHAELERRKQAAHDEAVTWIEQNVDTLLAIHTKHSVGWCSDKSPNNRFDCTRCLLLDVKQHGFYSDDEYTPEYTLGWFRLVRREQK